ncbi:hypothetical protein FM996_16240 [Methylosinus sporium]|uniref:Glycosyltransferase RgtA/B/C/D-like domain-containing protein n=1 Tax=Methylosinus sporium TaxID=428 RepID=A0A549SLS4_METSR|nr:MULTISPECIES: hypothetical protein [Methylosinus]MBU3887430.1 hypothetical protein [Methylosinus sp. KRF6]TRL30565.1 hypothetical protein FM996_16240 [Methylosinus sporium]
MLTSTDHNFCDDIDGARSSRIAFGIIAPFAACAAIFLLLRPYYGLEHDAVIYMGRGLADLDPQGVGRDIMFRFDGQSKFSVFSRLVDFLIPVLGLAVAAKTLALAGCALWFAALAALASRLARGSALSALLLLAACFDSSYGGFGVFHFAEPFATPRPFAEAFVLAAFAALLADRRRAAAGCLLAAAAFHPIIAAPGVLVALLYEGVRDRRIFLAALIAGAAALVAAFAGAPLLERLTARIDPQWAAIISARSDYIFLSYWPPGTWIATLRQASTLLLAASLAPPHARRLFFCVIAAACLGLSVSYALGDLMMRELGAQAQSWRALWLAAAFAPLALGLCAPTLWRDGAQGRIALTLLVTSWILRAAPESAFLALVGVLAWWSRERWSHISLALLERALFALCGLCAAVIFGAALWFAWEYARAAPSRDGILSSVLRAGEPAYVPLLFVSLSMLVARWRPRPLLAISTAAVVAPIAAFCWIFEPFPLRSADMRQPELEAIVASRAGEVLWLNDKLAPWVWLGRANWASAVQGSGVVFSREKALIWWERMGVLRDLGWVADSALQRRTNDVIDFPPFTRASLERLCGRADAPAWVVGAVESPQALAEGLEARFWRGPTRFSLHLSEGAAHWTPIAHYAIFDCAAYRPAG